MTTCPSKLLLSVAAIVTVALLPEALPLQAQERQQEPQPQTTQEGRRVHVVRQGDTLWDLANFYLSDPFLWPEIYRLNTMVVEDPHWIYPSEQLRLPGEGEVEVTVGEVPPGEVRVPGEEPAVVELPEVAVEEMPQELQELATVFVSRELSQETLTYTPIEPIPPVSVTEWDYYRAALLTGLADLGPRGEVIDYGVPSNIPIEEGFTPARYDRIYISHPDGEPLQPGDQMLIARIERQVKPYGWVVRPTGVAVIAAVHEEVSTAVVTEIFDLIGPGDRAVQLERFEMERGVFAEPVGAGPTGEVVALLDLQFVPSIEDQAFINVGRNQGLVPGDEFEIYVGERRSAAGYKLPEEHVAIGRVIRVTEETATLRVIEQRHPAIAVGLPVRLVGKMPS